MSGNQGKQYGEASFGRLPFKRAGLVAAALVTFAGAAVAAEPTAEELDQRIKVLERQLELQKEDADTKAKDATTASAGEKGFSLKKGDYELKFSALAQVDGRFFLDDGPTASQPAAPRFSDGFRLRRIRPTLQGSLGKLVGFRFTPEFAGEGAGLGGTGSANSAASVVDAYLDLKFDPAASLRIGKQKGPVGLERLQSGGALTLIERGYPTELVPNRDIGVALFGELLNSTTTYTVGLFNGARDGRDIDSVDTDNRHEVEGRVFFEPFKNQPGALQGLGFGIGGSDGGARASAPGAATLPQLRSPDQNVFFAFNATAQPDEEHARWTPQAYYYYNSFGLMGEYASSTQDVKNTVTTGSGSSAVTTVTKGHFTDKAFAVTASYVLSGEDASYKGVVKPKRSYAIGGPGWGAFEVAARYGQLDVDNDVFTKGFANIATAASKATSYDVGVNWYLTSNAKVSVDFDETKFDGGAAGGADRHTEKVILSRLQLSY